MEALVMKDVILKRCCGNCEWSISPECEEEIMKENHYEEDDPTRPRAGDCCLGVEHDGNYVCNHHEYLSGGLETYAFYEEKDLGPGYYVVETYWDHIIKYFKLYRTLESGNYGYGIRVCDLYPIKEEVIKGISMEIGKNDNQLLYKAITIFAKELGNNVIWDIDKKNFMSVNIYEKSTGLYFTGTNDNNFIDIKVKNIDDRIYKLIAHLFRNMAVLTSNMKNDEVAKKVRKLNR